MDWGWRWYARSPAITAVTWSMRGVPKGAAGFACVYPVVPVVPALPALARDDGPEGCGDRRSASGPVTNAAGIAVDELRVGVEADASHPQRTNELQQRAGGD